MCFGLLAIVIFLSFAYPAHGAQPRLSKSVLSSFLQQPTVSAIHRDKKGVLWIGTQQGLHKFDGAKMTVFNSGGIDKNWIPESEIKDIAEDSEGNLLVATSGGVLLKWNRQLEQFNPITQFGLVHNTKLVHLLVSQNGSIWLLTKDGLILYNPRFETTSDWVGQLQITQSIGRPQEILEVESGDIWVGGTLGLAKVDVKEMHIVSFDLAASGIENNSSVTALHVDDAANLIIGTSNGELAVWNIEDGKPLAHFKLEGNYISDLTMHKDMLIVGTDRGAFISNSQLTFIIDLNERGETLSSPDVYSLYSDSKHVWIGTINGLDILSFSDFELFNSKNGGISNDVLAFDEDSIGRIWVGTYSGLYLYDRIANTHSRFEIDSETSTLEHQRITAISAREGVLWLGLLQNGVQVINSLNGKSRSSRLTKTTVTGILETEKNNESWIATYTLGLFLVTSLETKSYYKSNALPEKSITVLFQSNTGIFLAVSENKIYIYNPFTDQFSQKLFNFGLNEKKPTVYSFAQAANDDIWIGTKDHGLYIWSRTDQLKNRFHLSFAKGGVGLSTSTIYGIEIDSEGNLWCSTQNGIVKLDPEGLLIKRFTETDGLQGNDFAFGASFTNQKGLIYFGGVNGYNRFDPSEVIIDTSISEMRLTDIIFPQKGEKNLGPISELKSLELTHKDHFVTFEFSVLDFIHPERNQFRYKLENFDPDWIENGTRNTATYTNLPADDYVLRIQGANSAGIWNREGISLNIRVLPAPWFSWWANCLYGISILLFIWGVMRIYQSYEAKRKSKQLTVQMFEAENRADDDMQEQLELQDELIHSAYHHNRTILSLMGDCISDQSNSLPSDIQHYFTESFSKRVVALSSLENSLFYQSGGPVANLKKYTDHILEDLLKDSPVNSQTIVTINEVSPKLLPAELASPLSIIIYELLENCIQHAFEVDSPANYIHITLTYQCIEYPSDYLVELFVRDSGTAQWCSKEDLSHASSGLSIVRSLVDKLGGTLEFSRDMSVKITLQHSDSEEPDNSTDQSSSS